VGRTRYNKKSSLEGCVCDESSAREVFSFQRLFTRALGPLAPMEWGAGFVLILLLVVTVYRPALNAGFIWDDDDYVTANMTLRDVEGLTRIWTEPTSIPQYYPVVHTTFWIEYQLWGDHPLGYHLDNVILHAVNAFLLWLVLLRLGVPGAFMVAAVFAVHPVHTESVAWVTERKNVLSGCFFLLSLLAYLRFRPLVDDASPNERGSVRFYLFSCVFYLAALLSKSVTVSLPAVLLLLTWWKKGRLFLKDLLPLVPMFLVGFIAASATVWLEKFHVGAQGLEWNYTLLERVLIAARALWFYAGKLIWPHPLIFNYPRWNVVVDLAYWYIFAAGFVFTLAVLWCLRRHVGRGPFTALCLFAGVLFPALGFFDVYPMRYSFVADHFQYLASICLITLGVAAVVRYFSRAFPGRFWVLGTCFLAVVTVLGTLTYRQSLIYESANTLWLDTVKKNPASWMAYYHLGWIRSGEGKVAEAETYYRRAIEHSSPPNKHHYMAMNNLAMLLVRQGEFVEAEALYREALELAPDYAVALNNLGGLLRDVGRCDEALDYIDRSLSLSPAAADAYNNRGSSLACLERFEEARSAFEQALRIDPEHSAAHFNLANILGRLNRYADAEMHFDAVVRLGVSDPAKLRRLASAYERLNRPEKARALREQISRAGDGR